MTFAKDDNSFIQRISKKTSMAVPIILALGLMSLTITISDLITSDLSRITAPRGSVKFPYFHDLDKHVGL